MDVADKLHLLADQTWAEGMLTRAADIRAGAIEIARLRLELGRLLDRLSDQPERGAPIIEGHAVSSTP